MLENPKITAEQIANNLENISAEGIRYHIRNLKKSGKIIREGSTKSGKWIVKGRENEQKQLKNFCNRSKKRINGKNEPIIIDNYYRAFKI